MFKLNEKRERKVKKMFNYFLFYSNQNFRSKIKLENATSILFINSFNVLRDALLALFHNHQAMRYILDCETKHDYHLPMEISYR